MSWDNIQQERRCPCGVGTYTATLWSNDWGQSYETREMNCLQCKGEYIFYEHPYFDERIGRSATLYRWVSIKEKEALDALKSILTETQRVTYESAKSRYLQQWLAHFADKSKKSIWQELKADGHCHVPALGTFYKHIKPRSTEKYLEWYFWDEEKLETVVSILGITDSKIKDDLAKISELKATYRKSEIEMLRNGVA